MSFDSNVFSSNEEGSRSFVDDRPPRHLKGRAIGMWYANRNKNRTMKRMNYSPEEYEKIKLERKTQTKQKQENVPVAEICLGRQRKIDVRKILSTLEDESYRINSSFMRKLHEIANGNIENKFESIVSMKIKRDEILDRQLKEELVTKFNSNPKYKQFYRIRQKLPCFDKKEEILHAIWNNQVTLISGETGCGKTTQVPQYILDKFVMDGNGSQVRILCTQPRRISALCVCDRVADERVEKVGQGSVGYQIRLEKKLPREKGSVTFCTTGIVLKQMESDPFLSNISHIILDEIHERDIFSDFLLTLLKTLISKRPDLKLILMSATFNSAAFAKYYNNKCAEITVPGFTYPVKEYYLEDVILLTEHKFETEYKRQRNKDNVYQDFIKPYVRQMKYFKQYPQFVCDEILNHKSEELDLLLIAKLIDDICQQEPGAILVFLPGYGDISKLCSLLIASRRYPEDLYRIYPLHSKMPTSQQREIFEVPPDGVRKIIIATNIAETSITINDVVYVIDCGKIKLKNYCAERNLDSLNPEWVSLANADQRRGRAGRVRAGICYHLFSRARKMVLEKQQTPEILRERLESVILQMKILQLGKVQDFLSKLPDPPTDLAILKSITILQNMEALDSNEKLTPLGYLLASLPMNPQMGKMLLLGTFFSCLDPILSVVVSLDFKDAFYSPLGKEQEAKEKKMSLLPNSHSDHLILHEALNRYVESKKHGQHKKFCWKYFLSENTLSLLHGMKIQLADYLQEMNFITNNNFKSEQWNVNSRNEALVKAIIAAGLYPNVALIIKNFARHKLIETIEREKVEIVPGSINSYNYNEMISPLFVYFLKLQSGTKIWLHDTTVVHPIPLLFFGDNLTVERQDDTNNCIIGLGTNRPLRYKCNEETANMIVGLRKCFNELIEWKISNPDVINWFEDSNEIKILKAVTILISSEETKFIG